MLKKSRRKIVASLVCVLALLFFGTVAVIYTASYVEVTGENRKMLRQYVEEYMFRDLSDASEAGSGGPGNMPRRDRAAPPMLELSTFYTVVLSKDGEVLNVDTADVSGLEEDALADLAVEIAESGQEEGTRNRLIYQMADKGDYLLVAFLDNTVMAGTTGTLINYTLLFGGVALVLLFFLSWYLAGRIVKPLEESYERQKQFISDAAMS